MRLTFGLKKSISKGFSRVSKTLGLSLKGKKLYNDGKVNKTSGPSILELKPFGTPICKSLRKLIPCPNGTPLQI